MHPGTRIGPYEIVSSLGAGGMGEVFRARDTRLNRDVAIKVLPRDFVSDADRLRRFEQEVKTLAALNHPNVLTIHDAGVQEGAPYLVSELLEGQTLREVLEACNGAVSAPRTVVADRHCSGLPTRKATDYALQIAQGLAAAYGKGIIHRDLKPENIFVTKDGRVKILDFGLAKLKAPVAADPRRPTSKAGEVSEPPRVGCYEEEEATTISVDAATIVNTTAPGIVLGTPAYMSPEQVRGEPADHRSDIFAFGCVLYEMLSGRRAFKRDTAVESMNAVLKDSPQEMAEVPFGLGRIAHRCLEKLPDNRFQSAHDLAFAIESARTGSIPAQAPLRSKRVHDKGLMGWVVAALAVVFALGTFFQNRRTHFGSGAASASNAVVSTPLLKLEIRVPASARPGKLPALKGLAISPDGGKLAYLNDEGLWWRWLDRLGPPTLLSSGEKLAGPFWSPDSTDVGWDENGTLMRRAIAGGRATVICHMSAPFFGGGAAWCDGGEIIFTQGGTGLFRVPAQGGNTELVLPPGEGELDFHDATAIPGGRGVVFVIHRKEGGPNTIAAWNPKDKKGKRILLHQPGSFFRNPTVCDSGHVLCVDTGARGTEGIWAIPISLSRLERTGEPLRIPDEGSLVSVSSQGTLVLSSTAEDLEAFRSRELVWLNRSGSLSSPLGPAMKGMNTLRLSPDESAVAVSAGERLSAFRVRILNATAGSELPFPGRGAIECGPFWLPNGREIALTAYESGELQTVIRGMDGGSVVERLTLGTLRYISPKGRYVFLDRHNQTNLHGYLDLSRNRSEWIPLPGNLAGWGAGLRQQPSLSPDETTLLYRSARGEIEAAAFPACTDRVLVASGDCQYPQWRRDGSEIFYLTRDGATMMSVPVTNTRGRRFGQPVRLFDIPEPIFIDQRWSGSGTPFDVSADGQRFLIAQPVHEAERRSPASEASVLLIQNWLAEFRERK